MGQKLGNILILAIILTTVIAIGNLIAPELKTVIVTVITKPQPVLEKPTKATPSQPLDFHLASKDNWLYYIDENQGISRKWLEKNLTEPLYTQGPVDRIFINGDWLYFSNQAGAEVKDYPGIFRISLTDKKLETVASDNILLYLTDQWLYYRNNQDIFRVKLDGNQNQLVGSVTDLWINLEYQDKQRWKPARIKPDGSGFQEL